MAGAMQFWGVEVKAKEPCKVSLAGGSLVHVSQITLGGIKKDDETVTIHVQVGEKKLVLALLSKNTPQMSFDLVFDEDFEISHNWKNGNIHVLGYQNEPEEFDPEIDSSDEELEDDVPIAKENGQLAAPAAFIAPAVMPKPEVEGESDEDGSSDEEFDGEDSDDDSEEDGTSVSEGEDDGSDGSDDSEEETPAKVVDAGKKRPNADAKTPLQSKKAKIATPQKTDGKKGGQPSTPTNADAKTPLQSKKAKIATPQKTDGKKGGQPSTPLSSKKGGKTPGGDKTPKSGGSDASCGSCKKTFKSGGALESHNKAKHGAK